MTGTPDALLAISAARRQIADAVAAGSAARDARSAAVRDALASGWSVRGLADALGVDKSMVQKMAAR